MRGRTQWLFLRWGRPVAPAATFAVYGVVALLRPETPAQQILLPLAVSVAAAVGYLLLLPRLGPVRVLRLLVVVDTLLIAWMTVALERPDVLAIAYLWSVAIAGVFLGGRETLAATALAGTCAAIVPYLGDFGAEAIVVVTDVVVIALVGSILAFVAREARDAETRLVEESRRDAAALRISETFRASLDAGEIVERALEELGSATGAARALCRVLAEGAELRQWVRPGVPRVEVEGVPATVAAVARQAHPLVVRSRAEPVPDDVRAYMEAFGTHAFAAYPVVWGGRVLAVIGFHHTEPRDWGPELELLERAVPQLAAALAQAEAFGAQRQLAEMREQLIANVSHELRTPLTATLGFLRTLERPELTLDDERRAELLRHAREQAERLALLVEDLLLLAKSGRSLPLDQRPVALAEVVEAAARGLDLGDRPLRTLLERDVIAYADPNRLVQVLSNLLSNAHRHGRGEIVVDGARDGGVVRVAVRDQGPPLPPEAGEAIFVPFARWSGDSYGVGLGLAISRGIAEAHGGSLAYEDGAFVLTLPAP